MQQLGFRSVFAKLFASVMLALTLFAVAMVLLTQLVHDKDAGIRSEVLATQILGQIDPFLNDLNVAVSKDNRLQARFMLAVVKKSFDIFDESLQAKMGLYDNDGHLLMQTDNSDLPLLLPEEPSLMTRVFPSFADTPPHQQAQVYSSTGYTLLYESRLPPKKPVLSAVLNLFTGTLLLLMIMAGVLWWIARTMTWRINQLSQQMIQLGDGDFSARVNARGNDEIASLAHGFNQAAQKIEHLINANNLLLAHASHELRTPMTSVREAHQLMLDGIPGPLTAEQSKLLRIAREGNDKILRLIDDLLKLAKLEADMMKLNLSPWRMEALIDAAVEEIRPIALQASVGLRKEVDENLPLMKVDGVKIQGVLTNLLSNAVKFTPPGGEVRVRAGLRRASASADEGARVLRISVSDTGTGIARENLERIFDKFYRAEDAASRQGSGLGLPIAKRMVEAHGGRIWAESQTADQNGPEDGARRPGAQARDALPWLFQSANVY